MCVKVLLMCCLSITKYTLCLIWRVLACSGFKASTLMQNLYQLYEKATVLYKPYSVCMIHVCMARRLVTFIALSVFCIAVSVAWQKHSALGFKLLALEVWNHSHNLERAQLFRLLFTGTTRILIAHAFRVQYSRRAMLEIWTCNLHSCLSCNVLAGGFI